MAVSGYERVLVLEALGKVETFKGCDTDALGLLADSVGGRTTIKAGDALCTEGDAADNWWIVLEGTAGVSSGGTEVGTVNANESVGELALFDGAPRSATVTALGDLDVLVFDKGSFLDVVSTSPPLALTMLSAAAQRLRATNALV